MPSYAEASYNQWSYGPQNRTKVSAAHARAAEDGLYDSPCPGYYEIPSTFGVLRQRPSTFSPVRQQVGGLSAGGRADSQE